MSNAGTVIVGGGIAGVALGYYLAAQGETGIVVLESKQLGSGCTAGSFGGVRQQFSTPAAVEFGLRGLRFWKTFEETFDWACPFHEDGYLMVTGNPAKWDALTRAAEVQRAAGAPDVHLVPAAELTTVVPWLGTEGLIGGSWSPGDGRVNPTDGLQGIVRAARRLGVTFRQGQPVNSIIRTPAGWLVDAPAPVVADRVVIAAGLGTPALARAFGLDLPITPMTVHTGFTTPMLGDQPLPLTIDLDKGFEVERETDGACFTIVSGRSPENYSATDMLEEFGEAAMVRAPVFAEAGIQTTITSYADETGGDGQPFAGQVEDGLWVLAGFDAHGTMMGPSFAEFLARLMAGHADPVVDAATYDPWRTPTTVEWMRSGSHH
ncbi:FAD-binding oxidoreductase [Nocardioides marmoriginsengisoli]|uniref:FAD-binding oxidoreductase n=1 Tax=Nocardioides marmoriginsengisoli TaxID=661483 RepID=A0A3N0CEM9_9ACTN|nr:FAD-binding oxidoreductase [Nocardioides marmoriginsengisoli]RNL61907.1 FAD-binding oxidoreductase [Nocardioides marmoriginsengisoli]